MDSFKLKTATVPQTELDIQKGQVTDLEGVPLLPLEDQLLQRLAGVVQAAFDGENITVGTPLIMGGY